MKKSELGRFRSTLKAIQLELSGGRRKREALAIETSPEELDQIQQAQERDSAMEALNRESVRLREVGTALDRMDRGGFGTCLNCQKDISAKRLAAVPWTALCIICQEAADNMTGDPGDALKSSLTSVV